MDRLNGGHTVAGCTGFLPLVCVWVRACACRDRGITCSPFGARVPAFTGWWWVSPGLGSKAIPQLTQPMGSNRIPTVPTDLDFEAPQFSELITASSPEWDLFCVCVCVFVCERRTHTATNTNAHIPNECGAELPPGGLACPWVYWCGSINPTFVHCLFCIHLWANDSLLLPRSNRKKGQQNVMGLSSLQVILRRNNSRFLGSFNGPAVIDFSAALRFRLWGYHDSHPYWCLRYEFLWCEHRKADWFWTRQLVDLRRPSTREINPATKVP